MGVSGSEVKMRCYGAIRPKARPDSEKRRQDGEPSTPAKTGELGG